MAVRNIKKQLAGAEDLLLGKGTQEQERHSGLVEITKLSLLQPVDVIEDLKELDTEKYKYAITMGSETMGDGKAGVYWFDETSIAAESLPDIVESNTTITGRWKRLTIEVS